jgi:hypothetical protein
MPLPIGLAPGLVAVKPAPRIQRARTDRFKADQQRTERRPRQHRAAPAPCVLDAMRVRSAPAQTMQRGVNRHHAPPRQPAPLARGAESRSAGAR